MNKADFYLKIDDLLDLERGTVKGGERLENLKEWDSLAVIGFIAMVDEEYGFNVPPKSIVACQTVDDLADLIAKQQMETHTAE